MINIKHKKKTQKKKNRQKKVNFLENLFSEFFELDEILVKDIYEQTGKNYQNS